MSTSPSEHSPIDLSIREILAVYFRDLEGTEPHALYDMVVKAVERPLLDVVMAHPKATRAVPPSGSASTATRCAASSSSTS